MIRTLLLVSLMCNVSLAASALDTANSAHKWHDRYVVASNRQLDAEAERDFCKVALHSK